jgi:phosphopantothenoylcysteine decarboxylase/phosphopantothenate--cysteine ligase
MPKKNIIVGVTASIAAYKACELVRILMKKGFSIRCVMTEGAKKFVTPLTFEALSGNKVASEMFPAERATSAEHVSLADEADVMLVAPATADFIAKAAAGISDDILLCTLVAFRKPVVIAPAMNDGMFMNPIIREKIDYLRKKGYHFVDPVPGDLVCGREGMGHLAPVDKIVEKVLEVSG